MPLYGLRRFKFCLPYPADAMGYKNIPAKIMKNILNVPNFMQQL